MDIDRRNFLKISAASAAVGVLPGCAGMNQPSGSAKVVVIGAGFGGATTAKYLRVWGGQTIDVTLIDSRDKFISCPLSNTVLGGLHGMDELTRSYDGLKKHGVNLVNDTVVGIDSDARIVKTARSSYRYDRLILSPGIDFMFDQIKGYNPDSEKILHAWKAGPQTVALKQQMDGMADGGTVVVSVPMTPYRCPPGPYERVCMMAHYLKKNKPGSRIIVLDANQDIVSKKGLFLKMWNETYPGLIEYRPNARVISVDEASMTVSTEFDDVKGDVLNVIPPQRAGEVTNMAGVRKGNWCPVQFRSYESTLRPYIHVIGDATQSTLPKSGHMANNMGKVCASVVLDLLAGREPEPVPVIGNTCYSVGSDTSAFHVATVYRYDAAKNEMVAQPGGGVSPAPSEREAAYAESWATNIWNDMFS